MTVKRAGFIKSLSAYAPYPGQGAPEIAMAGKSNVGKSSAINRITRMSKLAKVSSTPGKTRLINLFSINDGEITLVDLPGYGFAKAPADEMQRWGAMIENYFKNSTLLKRVFLLVDIRHSPTSDDKMMVDYLRHYDIPFTVLANKCDKISRAARGNRIPVICRELVVQPWQIIPFSAEKGVGLEEMLAVVEESIRPNQPTSDAVNPDLSQPGKE
ncbi:MAG: ribosome biogenesis GTP-binding protein YihA/YsxC [Clostridia bacterium]|nr:ribosome biogenesis GTP-binding protein YihA/YsxC [Clostridia bacterium]